MGTIRDLLFGISTPHGWDLGRNPARTEIPFLTPRLLFMRIIPFYMEDVYGFEFLFRNKASVFL